MPTILLFVLICFFWLIPLRQVCLWGQGFVGTPLTDWLQHSPILALWRNPPIRMFIPDGEMWIRPENKPPATLTPRGHSNIHTGEHYWLQVPYYVPPYTASRRSGSEPPTYMRKDQTSLSQLNSNGKFRVIQTVSSEATGLFCALTKAKHRQCMKVCECKSVCWSTLPPRHD